MGKKVDEAQFGDAAQSQCITSGCAEAGFAACGRLEIPCSEHHTYRGGFSCDCSQNKTCDFCRWCIISRKIKQDTSLIATITYDSSGQSATSRHIVLGIRSKPFEHPNAVAPPNAHTHGNHLIQQSTASGRPQIPSPSAPFSFCR